MSYMSRRPFGRITKPRFILVLIVSLAVLAASPAALAADAAFRSWLDSLWPEAEKLGVSRKTFDTATRGLEPDMSLPDLVRPSQPKTSQPGQAEFVKTPADYLSETTI